MFNTQKLYFEVSDEKEGGLPLHEAMAGATGTVILGKKGVQLWVPGDNIPKEKEIVFDLRNRPISPKDVGKFEEAAQGRFLTSHVALILETGEGRVEEALKLYDFVLVPSKKIKNTPKDFRSRVLGFRFAKK